ncbi:MAG: hypothetical protein RL426_140, partial [Pseudomonadota bacterium]
ELDEVFQIENPHAKPINFKWNYNYFPRFIYCGICTMAIALRSKLH